MVYDQLSLSIMKQKFHCQLLNIISTKLKETNSLKHRGGNARPRVINTADSRPIDQYIRRDNETTLKEIKEKLSKRHERSVSLPTISRHLRNHDYRSILPVNTPMLTDEQKQHRIEWAKKHQADDWYCTIFTDELSFHLFRNTIRRWSKNPESEVKRIPKHMESNQYQRRCWLS